MMPRLVPAKSQQIYFVTTERKFIMDGVSYIITNLVSIFTLHSYPAFLLRRLRQLETVSVSWRRWKSQNIPALFFPVKLVAI